jgi:hypothetical protein
LAQVKSAGKRLLLVTKRELASLKSAFGALDLFDIVVAENGAVLYFPKTLDCWLLKWRTGLRLSVGRPHWLILDEVHHISSRGQPRAAFPSDLAMVFITSHPENLSSEALAAVHSLPLVAPCLARCRKRRYVVMKENP